MPRRHGELNETGGGIETPIDHAQVDPIARIEPRGVDPPVDTEGGEDRERIPRTVRPPSAVRRGDDPPACVPVGP